METCLPAYVPPATSSQHRSASTSSSTSNSLIERIQWEQYSSTSSLYSKKRERRNPERRRGASMKVGLWWIRTIRSRHFIVFRLPEDFLTSWCFSFYKFYSEIWRIGLLIKGTVCRMKSANVRRLLVACPGTKNKAPLLWQRSRRSRENAKQWVDDKSKSVLERLAVLLFTQSFI